MKYAYLIMATTFVAVLVAVIAWRRDVWRHARKATLLGLIAGPVSELFFYRDYWQPPTILGTAHLSIEDMLFGAAVLGLSCIAYPCLTGKTFSSGDAPTHRRLFGAMFLIGLAGLLVGSVWLGINSIFVCSGLFIVFAAIMIAYRPDLLRPALYTAASLTALALAIYLVIGLFFPGYGEAYWQLDRTSFGGMLFGRVPYTELLWYFSTGLLAGIAAPFVSGAGFQRLKG